MKKNALRAIALMMAVLTLIPAMIACADQTDTGTPADTTAAVQGGDAGDSVATVAPETTNPYDANGYLKDTLSPDLNFGGYKFNTLGWNTSLPDFYVEMDTGDTVVDTIYYRNLAVEERLGITISANLINGDNSNQAPFVEHAMAAIQAGGDCEYDMIGCYSMCGDTLATRGALVDLATL
ncbi:MAG: hypothetical protein IKT54_04900, partial [Clostridia bacterium]|nr:hypothetical protein [Clostridia bacterium]